MAPLYLGVAGKPCDAQLSYGSDLTNMMRSLQSILIFAFLLVSLPHIVSGQVLLPSEATDSGLGGPNSIIGQVRVGNGRLERRINIRLETPTRGDRVTRTDEYGNFYFKGLVAGDYNLVIDKEKDFETLSQTVSIIQLRGGPSVTQNVQLRLIPKTETVGRASVVNAELAGVPAGALALHKRAIELANANDHKGAVEQLLLAVAEYPKFTLAYNDLGVQYLKLNDLGRADDAFKTALNIDPTSFAPLLNHGLVLFNLKRYPGAEAAFRDVVKAKADSAPGHYFLGQSLANQGRWDEAEKELNTGLTLGGEASAAAMSDGHYVLGLIYGMRNEKKRQIASWEAYVKLAPRGIYADQVREKLKQLKGN